MYHFTFDFITLHCSSDLLDPYTKGIGIGSAHFLMDPIIQLLVAQKDHHPSCLVVVSGHDRSKKRREVVIQFGHSNRLNKQLKIQ
jgi:hypothetical protein